MADEQSIAAFVRKIFGDKSFYEILEVETTADENTLKRAYRKFALVYHPGNFRHVCPTTIVLPQILTTLPYCKNTCPDKRL